MRKALPRKFQVPPNTIIPASGFKVFYANDFNNIDVAVLPFALSSAGGDEVYLSATKADGTLTGYRAVAEFGPSENGVSFGRYRTSVGVDFTAMSQRSFGVDTPLTLTEFRQGSGLVNPYPKVGPIVISEIMYHPPDIGTNDNLVEEFIELRNLTEGPVSLYDPAHPTNGWRLRSGVDFEFAPGTVLGPTNYLLVVSFDPINDAVSLAAFRARYGTNSALVGPYVGKLDNGGENIALLKPDPPQPDGSVPYITVEHIQYGDVSPWPLAADGLGHSLQRVSLTGYANEPTNWVAAVATPGPSFTSDRDGDGMPDAWETQYNFNVANAIDATQDADSDGLTNLQEYLAGTDPRDAASYLRIDIVAPAQGLVQIGFRAQAGKTYSILFRSSIEQNTWSKLTDIQAQAQTQLMTVFDSVIPGTPPRFYRLVTPNAP